MGRRMRIGFRVEIPPDERIVERKPVYGSCRVNSRECRQFVEHLFMIDDQLLSTALLIERKIDSQYERAFRVEAGIHGTQPDEALDHQSGADQQYQRECDLASHQDAA